VINPYIFREYDIRGVVGKDLTDEAVHLLARGYGTFFKHANVKSISIGGDVRLSTNHIRNILIDEISHCGIHVIDIGDTPTPVQYFSMFHLPVDAGIMITGSHNPPDYNGFKLTLNKAPVFGADIQKIKKIIDSNSFSQGQASTEKVSVTEDYIKHIAENVSIDRPLNIILDSGNGAAGSVAGPLFKALGQNAPDIYPEPDGNFPNHHPDPTVVDNIQDLIHKVKTERADFGVGYDGGKDKKTEIFESVADKLDNLKVDLKKAVENEEYERAADLRDKIKKIESES